MSEIGSVRGRSTPSVSSGSTATDAGAAPARLRFRSGNRGLFARLAEAIRNRRRRPPATPHRRFHLSLPSKKHAFTNNLAGLHDEVFGARGARRRPVGVDRQQIQGYFQADLDNPRGAGGQSISPTKPCLTADLRVAGDSGQLAGYSVSANPDSPALDTSKPVVLFLSGSDGPAEGYSGHIADHYVNGRGVNFLALNFRGFGESDDVRPTETTITKDGFAMLNHLLDQGFRPESIVVHGFSMGASVAARLQARVESEGHQLRGVIYDRPMSSAIDAGRANVIADEGADSWRLPLVGPGLLATTGALSTQKTLECLLRANPDGELRTPTFLTYDDDLLGPSSHRMGERLDIATIPTNAGHLDQASTVRNALRSEQLDAILPPDATPGREATAQFRALVGAADTQIEAAREAFRAEEANLAGSLDAGTAAPDPDGGLRGVVAALRSIRDRITPDSLPPQSLAGSPDAWRAQTQRISTMATQLSLASFSDERSSAFADYGTRGNPLAAHDRDVRAWVAAGVELAAALLAAQSRAKDGLPPLSDAELEALQGRVGAFDGAGDQLPSLFEPDSDWASEVRSAAPAGPPNPGPDTDLDTDLDTDQG